MSHTPGPWEVREGKEEVWGPAVYAMGAHDLQPLAAAETEADARLIAAAPDLLAALEQIQQRAVLGGRDTTGIEVIARAAIAKAKEPTNSAV
jgi:hypothetical protein